MTALLPSSPLISTPQTFPPVRRSGRRWARSLEFSFSTRPLSMPLAPKTLRFLIPSTALDRIILWEKQSSKNSFHLSLLADLQKPKLLTVSVEKKLLQRNHSTKFLYYSTTRLKCVMLYSNVKKWTISQGNLIRNKSNTRKRSGPSNCRQKLKLHITLESNH